MSETETEEEETEAESMSESESGSEEQKQESKGGGIDYIMSLPDVPRNLPPHVELQRTRVFANIDAPTHVFPTLQNPPFFNHSIYFILKFSIFINTHYLFLPIFLVFVVGFPFFSVKFGIPINFTIRVFFGALV